MTERHAAARARERCCRHALWLLALAGGVAVGQQAETFEQLPGTVLRAPDLYGLVVEHLCGDNEYLSCLAVSERGCEQDMRAEPLRQCGQKSYVTGFEGAQTAETVPPGMVECVYVAHITLRELDATAVNQCMTQAKLREPSTEEPAVLHDQPDQ